jgi:hypothetical protein
MPSTTKKTVNINSSEHKALEQKLDKLSRLVESSANAPINEVESVFQYLDTRRIPASDKPTAKDECAVDLALWALLVVSACEGHLKKSRVLDPALTKAWPRIWKWLEFLHIQCCQKSVFGGSFKIRALSMIPNTLMVLGRSNVLRRLATSTAGVITMVAKYWLGEGIDAGVEGFFKVAGMARPFTNALDSLLDAEDLTPDRLADVVAAAPGGAKMVARVAIQHLSDVSSFKQPDFETVYAHLSLINNLSCNSYPSLHLALLNRGMILAMVKMLVFCNMQPMDNVRIAGCVMMCYFTFIDALMTVNGPSWVVQAFDSGILPALLKSGRRLTQLDAHRRNLCTKLLSDLLCQYLVYRSVLRPIAKALRRTERLQIDEDVAGPLWDGWLLFKSLAEERIAIKDERDDEVQRKCNRVGVSEHWLSSSYLADGHGCSATKRTKRAIFRAAPVGESGSLLPIAESSNFFSSVSVFYTAKTIARDSTGPLTGQCVRRCNMRFGVSQFQ